MELLSCYAKMDPDKTDSLYSLDLLRFGLNQVVFGISNPLDIRTNTRMFVLVTMGVSVQVLFSAVVNNILADRLNTGLLVFACRPANRNAQDAIRKVADRFPQFTSENNQRNPVKEYIDDPVRIRRILHALAKNQTTGFVRLHDDEQIEIDRLSMDGQAISYRLDRFDLGDSSGNACEDLLESNPQMEIYLSGYNSVYFSKVSNLGVKGVEFRSEVPKVLLRYRHRFQRRLQAPDEFEIEIRHPRLACLNFKAALHDMSYQGVSFRAPFYEWWLRTCKTVEGIIRFRGRYVWRGSARIRYVRVVRMSTDVEMDLSIAYLLQLLHVNQASKQNWEKIVNRYLHPNTGCDAIWTDEIWSLYQDSGYFRLSGKSPIDFDDLRVDFGRTNRLLDAWPELGCRIVWFSESGVDATLSVTRQYKYTWLFHQLAKRRRMKNGDTSKGALGDVYRRAFEYMQAQQDFHWHLGYFEAGVGWHHRILSGFFDRYKNSPHVFIEPFRLMEFTCSQRLSFSGLYRIDTADDAETSQLLDWLNAHRPTVYREALDYVPERMGLDYMKAIMKGAGFASERKILVAGKNGRMVASAVCESGQNGLNLFRLYDGVRMFALTPEGHYAFGDLLEAAKLWYRGLGKKAFVLFDENNDKLHWLPTGKYQDLGKGSLAIYSKELIPDFLEYIQEISTRDT